MVNTNNLYTIGIGILCSILKPLRLSIFTNPLFGKTNFSMSKRTYLE